MVKEMKRNEVKLFQPAHVNIKQSNTYCFKFAFGLCTWDRQQFS